ncbi:MAG: methylenetetrahydrofolate reductase, partial [Bacteroidota bacterium]|nr:methylenetetrahydrofolate reductase [Bacteroidota bacterium]
MKVIDQLKNATKTQFSFEVLPPLKGGNINSIYRAIDPLIEFNPININVTYHQQEVVYKKLENGLLEKRTIRKRPGSVAIAAAIKFKYKVTVVPHIICGGFDRDETEDTLIDFNFLGMNNLLALRGDPPKSVRSFIPEENGHAHTTELVKQIKNMNRGIYLDEKLENPTPTDFCVGVAGYPEKHYEAPNMENDLLHLKEKVDAGADYIVTQMFFNNKYFFEFVEKCRKMGITVPIVPGIKPIMTLKDISVLPKIFSIEIPEALV